MVLCSCRYSFSITFLFLDQEEADTRLQLNAKMCIKYPTENCCSVTRHRCCRCYVLLISKVSHVKSYGSKQESKIKPRFIPIHFLQSSLRPLVSKALPACRALSDITKKRACKVFINDAQAKQQLTTAGEEPFIREPRLKSYEAFICTRYTTVRRFDKADNAQYLFFCQRNKTSENMSPTSESLSHHIKRNNFQTYLE